jgi:hypothetical protein
MADRALHLRVTALQHLENRQRHLLVPPTFSWVPQLAFKCASRSTSPTSLFLHYIRRTRALHDSRRFGLRLS